jgi:hypothetical protein
MITNIDIFAWKWKDKMKTGSRRPQWRRLPVGWIGVI